MDDLEAIRLNAEMVAESFGQTRLGYDGQSVAWLDGFIERNRLDWDPEMAEKLVSVLGSFLGECVRRHYGGDWVFTESGPGVSFDEENTVYPFNKIRKHIQDGSQDSVASFYELIPIVFKDTLG